MIINSRHQTALLLIMLISVFLFAGCAHNTPTKVVSGDKDQDAVTPTEPVQEPQPETPQPETPQPETPQPETPQPETPQPEAPQPEAPQPETPQPETKYISIGTDVYSDFSKLPEPLETRDSDDGNILVLVNKLHAVSKSYVPVGLVDIPKEFMTPGRTGKCKQVVVDAFSKMRADAAALGHTFSINSPYRSYDLQNYYYSGYVKNYGKASANTFSAYPGRSEHHTGLVLDVSSKNTNWRLLESFYDTAEGKWIYDNCANYGFIVRYPKGKDLITGYKFEPWHLRYVGVDVAKEIMSKEITFEEYLGYM